MLNFDENRYLKIQSGAVGLGEQIKQIIDECLAKGAENLFFLGTGGISFIMDPAYQLLSRHSTFPVFKDWSAELMLTDSRHLGSQSIVIMPSLSGTTLESIEMTKYAQKKGATVITLVGNAESELGKLGDYTLENYAQDDTSSESFYIQSLLISLSILANRNEIDNYNAITADLAALPAALIEAKSAFEKRAEQIAQHIASADYHIFSGAGNTWPESHYYGMCILEEMQWIRTRPVHASDFFHGTLELVEPGVSIVLLKGEDSSRSLAERVEKFARSYTEELVVIDSAEVKLEGISNDTRPLLSPIILAALLERVSAHLEVIRDHPLTTRRYYRKVAY